MVRRLSVRLFALVVVVLTALPVTAFAKTRYLCRMMGGVVDSCCCAKEHQRRAPVTTPEVRGRDCCETLESPMRASLPAVRALATELAPPAPIAIMPVAPVMIARAGRLLAPAPEQARAPPRFGPRLFLKHCVLLT